MSHQSGIKPDDELIKVFSTCAGSGSKRLIKVIIRNDTLTVDTALEPESTSEQDFSLIQPLLTPTNPCYILFRLDKQFNNGEYQWLFMAYVPDHAHVRDKMLYASSRATLSKELGDSRFIDSIYATTANDLTHASYEKQVASTNVKPLTDREVTMMQIKKTEVGADISATGKRAHAAGLKLDLSEELETSLTQFVNGETKCLEITVDMDSENIQLVSESKDALSPETIAESLPTNEPRYILFKFEHEYDGTPSSEPIFVYYCPSKSPSKQKMVFSSTKNAFLQSLSVLGVTPARKYEFDESSELNSTYLMNDLRPPVENTAKTFSKPARPGRPRKN